MLNKIILQGRLGADPELKTTPNGVEVVTVNVACDRDRKDANGQRQTDWVTITAWRNTAKFLSTYFQKGSSVLVEGRLQTRSYTDKEGNKRTAFEVVADNVHFCSGTRAEENRGSHAWEREPGSHVFPDAFEELGEDDGALPF